MRHPSIRHRAPRPASCSLHGQRPRARGRTGGRDDQGGTRCRPGARRPRSLVPLRPRPQGLPGDGKEPDLEDLVHDRQRRPVGRLLPDDRQHERRDTPVHRDRWVDLHRPPESRHDVHGPGPRRDRDGVPGDQHREEREVQPPDRLRHRPVPELGAHADGADLVHGRRAEGLRPPRCHRERQRRWRQRQRRSGFRDGRHLKWSPDRGVLRYEHGHQRRQPRLRTAGVCRP